LDYLTNFNFKYLCVIKKELTNEVVIPKIIIKQPRINKSLKFVKKSMSSI